MAATIHASKGALSTRRGLAASQAAKSVNACTLGAKAAPMRSASKVGVKPFLAGSNLRLFAERTSQPSARASKQVFASATAESGKAEIAYEPVVTIENGEDETTLVTVTGDDREGILNEITNYFTDMGLKVQSANIFTSEDGQVVDCFSVTTEEGNRLDEDRWEDIKISLRSVLGSLPAITASPELLSGIDDELSEQVAMLSSMLEDAVRMQGDKGDKVVEICAGLSSGFAELRATEDPRTRAELLRTITEMDTETLSTVIRFFSTYSNLLSTAEESHVDCKRRGMVRASETNSPLWYASFHDTFTTFKNKGVPAGELQELLNRMSYRPVITAHPTEARRRIVLVCLRKIFDIMAKLENGVLGVAEREELKESLRAQVQLLWSTDEMQSNRPKVLDEIDNGLNYFRYSLIEASLQLYRYADRSAAHIYGKGTLEMPSFIKFGSWIGGDRDGNPFVKPDTTRVAALLQSRMILAEYVRRLRLLQDSLTQSTNVAEVPAELLSSIAEDRANLKMIPGTSQFDAEPFRLKLRIIRHRVEQNLRWVNSRLRSLEDEVADADPDELFVDLEYNIDELPGLAPGEDRYRVESDLISDMRMLQNSLKTMGLPSVANGALLDVIRLAETFGFYMMQLDIRQESTVHTEAVSELLAAEALGGHDYGAMSTEERLEVLAGLLASPAPGGAELSGILDGLSESTRETVEISQAVADIKEWISPDAIGAYCISMARNATHVLEVMLLAWITKRGLVSQDADGTAQCNLLVTPLFETIPDLENMPGSLRMLLSNPTYRSLLAASGDTQEVMLGYSDSCKDGGIFASAFNLYKAQLEVTSITDDAGVSCRIFHGRGGTLGRGSGPAHESILAQPPGTLDGTIKFTEQGETVTYRYGNTGTAINELTVGITGLLKASHPKTRLMDSDDSEFLQVAENLAKTGENAYRGLTDDTEGFYEYFYTATVVDEIALMNIGSRPAKRKAAVRDKTSLRAIPWVFAWSQSRHTLPAWFGVGSALYDFGHNQPENLVTLRRMYNDWPWFRNFLSNTEMSIYKANMDIAKEYSALCKDRITQQLVYDLINCEYDKVKKQILLITGQASLLDREPALQGSLEARNPYLDSLNMIQVILLMKRRDAENEEASKELEMPLLRSIKAIAAGMRNTG